MPSEFRLFTTKRFERSFRKLDKVIRNRVLKAIEELKTDPYAGRKMITKPLLYIRVGDYRVFYYVDEENERVILVDVVHRRAAYR